MNTSKLSRVETDQSPLSIDQVLKLSEALGIPFASIAQDKQDQLSTKLRVVTKASRGRFFSAEHCDFEALCTDDPGLGSFFWQVEVKQTDGGELVYKSHPGIEFIFVLSGDVEIRFRDGESTVLSSGDAFKFDSSVEHAYISRSTLNARLLMVNAPE
jgi:mannose-6-phosphate isomerase-like protein (cupin superfamily)